MRPELFFILTPLVMILAWALTYAFFKQFTFDENHRAVGLTLGILVLLGTTALIVNRYYAAKEYYTPANIKQAARGNLTRLYDWTDHSTDLDGNVHQEEKTTIDLVTALGEKSYTLQEVIGPRADYEVNQEVIVYEYDGHFFLARYPLDTETRDRIVERHRKESIYLMSLWWVLFGAMLLFCNADEF